MIMGGGGSVLLWVRLMLLALLVIIIILFIFIILLVWLAGVGVKGRMLSGVVDKYVFNDINNTAIIVSIIIATSYLPSIF
jgi:hypothetical protein